MAAPALEVIEGGGLTVRAFVRELIEESVEADPITLARAALDELPEELARDVLLRGLEQLIRIEFGRARGARVQRDREDTPDWRARQRERYDRGELPWQQVRVFVPSGGWKLLAECSQSDLGELVEDRAARARELEAGAERFERLRGLLTQRKRTLADVDPLRVQEAWNGS